MTIINFIQNLFTLWGGAKGGIPAPSMDTQRILSPLGELQLVSSFSMAAPVMCSNAMELFLPVFGHITPNPFGDVHCNGLGGRSSGVGEQTVG